MAVRDIVQAAAGAGGAAEGAYIEDVFSCFLYTGNGSTQTITNGIDLDGEGGLVWIKNRDQADNHVLTDTERGATEILASNTTDAEAADADTLTAFNSDGFAIGADVKVNTNTEDYASWAFRKAPKFFDVVTYTGTGSARTVSHNLGSVPGCIIVKRTDSTGDWIVYHRANTANPETDYLELNDTAATADLNTMWNDTAPTSTEFTVGTNADVNASTATYVAYLWAHDDGGFGDDGLQNVISCGSYTGTGSALSVNLGYEPQWLFVKRTNVAADWNIVDNMRGFTADGVCQRLEPNTSDAEATSGSGLIFPTATGFGSSATSSTFNNSGDTYIYIAIRRGPMKTPESGTEVFAPFIGNSSSGPAYISNFVVDTGFDRKFGETDNMDVASRLTGANKLVTSSSAAEAADGDLKFDYMTGYYSALRNNEFVSYMFRRAPGFFDVVCYTGTGSARTVAHNLGVVPEMMIIKSRSNGAQHWYVYLAAIWGTGIGGTADYDGLRLNSNAAAGQNNATLNSTQPTVSVFSLGTLANANESGATFVNYLFATLAGISKVGSYTGTGTTLQINCGFSAGARFVMIKRTDSTGDWYVWDTARGIIAGNDPFLLLNSTAAENTSTDYIDPLASGFEISSTAPAAINASGGTFIFLAIA